VVHTELLESFVDGLAELVLGHAQDGEGVLDASTGDIGRSYTCLLPTPLCFALSHVVFDCTGGSFRFFQGAVCNRSAGMLLRR